MVSHYVVEIGEKVKRSLMFLIIIGVVNTVFAHQILSHSNISSPTLKSKSGIVIEAETEKVLYEKNPHCKMYPASLTKIATAIYAIEKGNINDIVTVTQKASDATDPKYI